MINRRACLAGGLAAVSLGNLAPLSPLASRAWADTPPRDLHEALARAADAGGKIDTLPRWEPGDGDVIRFRVLRKGTPFGQHEVRFERGADGSLVARTKVSLRAGLGPITVYRYDLEAVETWRDGAMVALEGELNNDGKTGRVEAAAQGGVLVVNGTEFTGQVPLGILPSSHWNLMQTRAQRILSTEDGEIIEVDVRPRGREVIEAGGRQVEAMRYLMDSDIDVDLWYDGLGRWVKLAFTARGQDIEYVLDQTY